MLRHPSFPLAPTLAATAAALLFALLPAACSRPADEPLDQSAAHTPAPASPAPTNRVDVPPPVRQNLGITFATVERRAVAQTVRVPGRFELLPDARREHRTMIDGQVELAVSQFDPVAPGTLLYRLRSPRWREMQQQIAEAHAAIRTADASAATIGPLRAAHHAHEQALDETVALWAARIEQLDKIRDAGGGKADELAQARATLATSRAELADVLEKDAELEAREREIAAQLDAARTRAELLLATASTLVGIPADRLAAPESPGAAPLWRTLDVVEVRATSPGIVESITLTGGAWAGESSLVLTTIQPDRLRFHARGLQSDLGSFSDGLPARIAPPGGGIDPQRSMEGTLTVGLGADPEQRTVDLYTTPGALAPWARPGVSAYMEITLAGGTPEFAVPLASVTQDGLTAVLFRRDPKDPNKVIRLEADLGLDDGRWVVVKSGVREGDEVVLDGVYQLMLATSGTAPKGGHFHSDGTFHEGED